MTQTKTTGQQLANTIRRYFHIGTRTRRYRDGRDMVAAVLEEIKLSNFYPGSHTGDTETAFRAAYAVWQAWDKHVDGYRIDPVLRSKLDRLSPYRIVALLGQMVDAGVTNNGEGELFFQQLKLA